MKFNKQQIADVSNAWRQFHKEGKHKKKPRVVESGVPETCSYYFKPQTHMISDLQFCHHVMYNFFRNLPLDRGMNLTRSDVNAKVGSLTTFLWYIFNNHNRSEKSDQHKQLFGKRLHDLQEIFGPMVSIEVLEAFREKVFEYKYSKIGT